MNSESMPTDHVTLTCPFNFSLSLHTTKHKTIKHGKFGYLEWLTRARQIIHEA